MDDKCFEILEGSFKKKNVLEDAECLIYLYPKLSASEFNVQQLGLTFSGVGIKELVVLICLSTMFETKSTRMFSWFFFYIFHVMQILFNAWNQRIYWSEMFMNDWCWATVFSFHYYKNRSVFLLSQYLCIWYYDMQHNCQVFK